MAKVIPTPLPLPAETEVRQNLLYWEDRYKRRCFEWHIEEVHPHLLKYLNLLTQEDSSSIGKHQLKFFLPLCGKSKDIPFLLDIGHEVFGVEAVDSVIQEFIKEN